MECHHWISVWAWADKLARPRVRAERVSLSFMAVPENEEAEIAKGLSSSASLVRYCTF
jgi:hypothetical protein